LHPHYSKASFHHIYTRTTLERYILHLPSTNTLTFTLSTVPTTTNQQPTNHHHYYSSTNQPPNQPHPQSQWPPLPTTSLPWLPRTCLPAPDRLPHAPFLRSPPNRRRLDASTPRRHVCSLRLAIGPGIPQHRYRYMTTMRLSDHASLIHDHPPTPGATAVHACTGKLLVVSGAPCASHPQPATTSHDLLGSDSMLPVPASRYHAL
jgi:hypothetical protein